ncbi:Fanconi anemia-associated protein of 24 kDa [Oopsacas minuta]|uniref:Fanconi anemia-associated protein of 24 kDa n=1 Tax=Oopsacas minuta TaxID=111878 RepID=A0AAV7K1Y7_9METZ|nr:Fanconi anemia-associated protein of 24 kDa [Oopsacas minuta]
MATQSKCNPHSSYKVPEGYLFLNRLAGRELHDALKDKFHVNIDGTLGPIDIMYLDGKGVLYLEENALDKLEESKKRVLTFKNVNQGIVMLESVNFYDKFMEFQDFVVIELKLSLMMVGSKSEAADLLGKIIKEELNPRNNPFLLKHKQVSNEICIINALQNIPKLGPVKARLLMENYQTLDKLLKASGNDINRLIGKVSAEMLFNFLYENVVT